MLLAPPLAPARDAAEAPDWLADLLEARGVHVDDWTKAQVERRTFEDGAWRVETLTLQDLAKPATLPGEPAAPTPDDVPDVVAGALAHHVMYQVEGRHGCPGYAVEPVAETLAKVGGTWTGGMHYVFADPERPGVDMHDPAGSLTGATTHPDTSVAALGSVTIVQNRFSIFDICILVGTMTGQGVFAFDETWPQPTG